jgi:hypothetical protein
MIKKVLISLLIALSTGSVNAQQWDSLEDGVRGIITGNYGAGITEVSSLCAYGSDLFVGGYFNIVNHTGNFPYYQGIGLAQWDNTSLYYSKDYPTQQYGQNPYIYIPCAYIMVIYALEESLNAVHHIHLIVHNGMGLNGTLWVMGKCLMYMPCAFIRASYMWVGIFQMNVLMKAF